MNINLEAINRVPQDHSEVTKMLEKRRQLYEIEEAFNLQTEEFKKNTEKFKVQEDTIKRTDNKIQEKFIRHCKFLAENKDKRNRAKRHMEEEKLIKKTKIAQVKAEEEILDQLERQKMLFEAKINQLQPYETYLQKVVDQNCNDYKDIKDLLQRFQTLQLSNKRLKEHKEDVEKQLNSLNQEIATFEKNKNVDIMILNNGTTNFQKQYEILEMKNNKIQDEVKASEQNNNMKMSLLAKLMLTIDNLYEITKKSDVKIFLDKNPNGDQTGTSKIPSVGIVTNVKNIKNENAQQQNIFSYDIDGIMMKLRTITATAETIKRILEMSAQKKVKI